MTSPTRTATRGRCFVSLTDIATFPFLSTPLFLLLSLFLQGYRLIERLGRDIGQVTNYRSLDTVVHLFYPILLYPRLALNRASAPISSAQRGYLPCTLANRIGFASGLVLLRMGHYYCTHSSGVASMKVTCNLPRRKKSLCA